MDNNNDIMINTGPSISTTQLGIMINNNNNTNNTLADQDFIFQDFMMEETNFDQFISLIREDNNVNHNQLSAVVDFGRSMQVGNDDQFGPLIPFIPPPAQPPTACDHDDLYHDNELLADGDILFNMLNAGGIGINNMVTPDTVLLQDQEHEHEHEHEQDQVLVDQDDDQDEDYSSATTMSRKVPKSDRSRTLVSERKRRGRMKEKLYALRALVPNITKMDKASIVGDAVLYVQDLQKQAKKLKAEIAHLQLSSIATGSSETTNVQQRSSTVDAQTPISSSIIMNQTLPNFNYSMIIEMDVLKVEERGLYVRVGCNRGKGVAVSLYKALESLITTTTFNVLTSNLATATNDHHKFIFTFTLNVIRGGVDHEDQDQAADMNLQTLKLWIATAFMNQGFHFKF